MLNSKLLELIRGDIRVRVACELLLDRTSNVTEDVLIYELSNTVNAQERMLHILYRETGQRSFITFLRDDMSCDTIFETIHMLYRNWEAYDSTRITYPYLNRQYYGENIMDYILEYFFKD